MTYIYWLSQIQHSEQSLVGNQLYILSQLLQHELPILPGFVLGKDLLSQLLTNSGNFQSLIKELSNSSFSLDIHDALSLQSVASRSRQIITETILPQALQTEIFQTAEQLNSDNLILEPFFSTPSGQALIHQGFLKSYTCNLHPQALTQTIKHVWSELFAAKNLAYRHKLGFEGKSINLEILVRPLRNTFASGMVEITTDVIKIKAVWGHVRSLLQGDVEPDEYYLDRHTGIILSRHLGHKNYAYRVPNIGRETPRSNCLEAYIPEEAQTKTYVLTEKAISAILELTRNLLAKQPEIKYFFWTVPTTKSNNPLNFFITQFGKDLVTKINLFSKQSIPILLSSTHTKPLLRGISAAPGKVVAKVVAIADTVSLPESIPADSILVMKNITPNRLNLIKQAKGIITEVGGKTSHGAIIARELKIPALVNAKEATTILKNGVEVFLDGDGGAVYPATAIRHLPLPDLSQDGLLSQLPSIATKLMVNISQPQSIVSSRNLPIDGVGLLRAELMMGDLLTVASSQEWQSESFQSEFSLNLIDLLKQFLSAFAPRPVFYRSLDWTNQDGTKGILGNRGTYSYKLDPTLFSLELNALLAIAKEGYSNFNLILPFVRSVEEFQFCYRQLENVGLTDRKSFQVWIMAEVPSVIWLLPEYIKAGVQGIAIGTNDLTQLLLGVDREQEDFSDRGLNANHPAVHQAISRLIAIAKENDIDCCICGQGVVEYPDLIDKLVNWGINSISVEPEAVNRTYMAIARAERKILLNALKKP